MQINPEPQISTIGGKAYQLHRLQGICEIPPFFVVAFEHPTEINDPIAQKAIIGYFISAGFGHVSVRSSATVEDSENSSFAGMFETVLNVDFDGLIAAIKTVLNSMSSTRVIEYSKLRDVSITKLRMNVIIQKMVASRVSGVSFTRTNENSDSLIIEACFGLGDALVSGKITPDTYMVRRKDFAVFDIKIGYQRLFLRSDAGWSDRDYDEVPFHQRNAQKLVKEEIMQVAKTSLLIERQLGFDAADVEWAFESKNLFILQARPYTGFSKNIL